MKVFCKEFITVWTRGLVRWLSRKFESISIDLTPVEERLDEVKSDVADVKTAVEHIDFSTLAKEQTLTTGLQNMLTELYPKATTAQLTKATQQILTAIGQINFSSLAKQGTNPNATNTAILAAFGNIDFSTLAKQGTNAEATLTAVLEALTGGDDPSPDIPEGVAERLAMILEHFGIKTISGYEFMTDTEVTDELEDIMQAIDTGLTAEQAASITAEAMDIINSQNNE